MSEKIPLLVLNSLSEAHQAQVAAVYDMTYLPVPTPAEREALIAARGRPLPRGADDRLDRSDGGGDRRDAQARTGLRDGRGL